jgi:hypothetical protein
MATSINSRPSHTLEKQKVARFHRLDSNHISAIESLYKTYPFLSNRVEIHMPYHMAKPTFTSGKVWLWPKFDKRPVGYLIFMEGFAPCIWYPERQEGMTFRWLLPPTFHHMGPTVCLANILAGESMLQIEDIVVYQGNNLWTSMSFSSRWNILRTFWNSIPPDQHLLEFTVKIVIPITLADWPLHYNPSIYWIIQHDNIGRARWYWKDTITEQRTVEYVVPKLKRNPEMLSILYAQCVAYTKMALPDTYNLVSQEGEIIGIASIATIDLSLQLRKLFQEKQDVIVEVRWHENFNKYQIVRIMPKTTPISTSSFFYHKNM